MNILKFCSQSVATVAVLLLPLVAIGATMNAGEEVVIPAGETIEDNVYVAGGTVSVNRAVTGDVLAAGGTVLISESVTDDVAAAGGTVTLLGASGGDARLAGGTVLVNSQVTGDLMLAGGTVTVSPLATVGNDLVVGAGQATIAGAVAGDATIGAGVASISGSIDGDVTAYIDEQLVISEGAVINGTLTYHAKTADALQIADSASVTVSPVFVAMESSGVPAIDAKNVVVTVFGALFLFKLFAAVVAALVLVWLFPKFSWAVTSNAFTRPGTSLGYGFVALIIVPAAVIILLVTVLGIPLAILLGLAYVAMLLLSSIYAGVVTGAGLYRLFNNSDAVSLSWPYIITGTFVLMLVGLIPVLGWIAVLVVWLITMGGIVSTLKERYHRG